MIRLLKVSLAIACLAVSTAFVGCGGNGASEIARENIGRDGDKGFMFKTLVRGTHTRKFGLFVPLSYRPTTKYPVVIFLQGIGEGAGIGEGDGKNMTVGLGPFVGRTKDTFQFICIFPQSSGGWDANSQYAEDVITALDEVSKSYSVDPDRVILTGLSTGGYGTYVIGAKYADRFAAIVPMGSNGRDTSVAPLLKNVAVRAYCSETGDIFAGDNDKVMVESIRAAGGRAEFIATPTVGHNCWDYVYGSGDLFAWMQAQRRVSAKPATPAPRAGAAAPITAPVVPAASASPVRANTNAMIPATTY
jgi:predicted peptidase